MRNVHERMVEAPVEEVGPLLDRLGGSEDVLWPSPAWPPMVLDRPVAVGARGGHVRVRYRVVGHEPGRRVEFSFEPGVGVDGGHVFTAEPAGPDRTLLRHVLEGRPRGVMRFGWPLAVRWLHDAVLEELLDNAERAVGREPARPVTWSPWVRLLHPTVDLSSVDSVPVPATPLLADALPRVDWADAYAVAARPSTPADPQVWADAVFRDPPDWVVALLGLRERLVGVVGIERGGWGSFETVARTEEEVLLGADAGHLDFRVSVLREPTRVVLTTVVQVHNARGRAYDALARRGHPTIVRAMLARAARLLTRTASPARLSRT